MEMNPASVNKDCHPQPKTKSPSSIEAANRLKLKKHSKEQEEPS
jgi:hypothetical protein